MSEPQVPPPDAGVPTVSAAEHAALQKRLADSEAHARDRDREATDAIEEAIAARADAFVHDVVGLADRTMYAGALRAAYVLAARDDRIHPLATRAERQDALRAVLSHRGVPTKQVVSADPARRDRALGMDPADEDPQPGEASEKELEALYQSTKRYAQGRNGRPRPGKD